MNATELYNLLDQNKEKLTLIDGIMEFYPGMGAALGWSVYKGSLGGAVEWSIEALLKAPYILLQNTLTKWKKETEEAVRTLWTDASQAKRC